MSIYVDRLLCMVGWGWGLGLWWLDIGWDEGPGDKSIATQGGSFTGEGDFSHCCWSNRRSSPSGAVDPNQGKKTCLIYF